MHHDIDGLRCRPPSTPVDEDVPFLVVTSPRQTIARTSPVALQGIEKRQDDDMRY